tara:strand:+ start:239 stop:481 length:243 start_codon:yes stop_codon:yes gene_type:complete
MENHSHWLSKREASVILRVDEEFLEMLREEGHLKPGTHWKSAPDPTKSPWNPKAFYQISWCREVIEKWKNIEKSNDLRAA